MYSQVDTVNPDTSLPVNSAKMEQNLLPSPLFGDCKAASVPHVLGLWPLPAYACTVHVALVNAGTGLSACYAETYAMGLDILGFCPLLVENHGQYNRA